MTADLRQAGRLSQALLLAAALACAAASSVCWLLFFLLYWPQRDRFDEAGRYVDTATGVVHHAQSGALALPGAALALAAGVLAAVWHARRRARRCTPPGS